MQHRGVLEGVDEWNLSSARKRREILRAHGGKQWAEARALSVKECFAFLSVHRVAEQLRASPICSSIETSPAVLAFRVRKTR
jgi:hypothetical protein